MKREANDGGPCLSFAAPCASHVGNSLASSLCPAPDPNTPPRIHIPTTRVSHRATDVSPNGGGRPTQWEHGLRPLVRKQSSHCCAPRSGGSRLSARCPPRIGTEAPCTASSAPTHPLRVGSVQPRRATVKAARSQGNGFAPCRTKDLDLHPLRKLSDRAHPDASVPPGAVCRFPHHRPGSQSPSEPAFQEALHCVRWRPAMDFGMVHPDPQLQGGDNICVSIPPEMQVMQPVLCRLFLWTNPSDGLGHV